MAKRGSNIYKRKDGRFEGRVPIGYQDNGKIKYKSVYARTLSEVKEKMSEMYSVRQNRAVSPMKLTVADAAEQWLSSAKPVSYTHLNCGGSFIWQKEEIMPFRVLSALNALLVSG